MTNGIIHVRVDDRLVHGLVANYWIAYYQSTRCMVVNEEASSNDMIRASLKMATPAGVNLSVLAPQKAIANIQNGNYARQRVFVVSRTIKDVYALFKNGVELPGVTLGNVTYNEGETRSLDKTVRISEAEAAMLKEMIQAGVRVISRLTVEDEEKDVSGMLD